MLVCVLVVCDVMLMASPPGHAHPFLSPWLLWSTLPKGGRSAPKAAATCCSFPSLQPLPLNPDWASSSTFRVSSLQNGSHFVFIPGPGDPCPGDVLPQPPLPSFFTEHLRAVLPKVSFASNPCRQAVLGGACTVLCLGRCMHCAVHLFSGLRLLRKSMHQGLFFGCLVCQIDLCIALCTCINFFICVCVSVCLRLCQGVRMCIHTGTCTHALVLVLACVCP